MSNPFSDFAKANVPYAAKRKAEKAALKPTPQEQKKLDQEKLHELWLEDFAKRKKALVEGEHAGSAMALCAKLENLGLDDGDELIELARAWQGASRTTRFLVLQLIDEALVELRTRHGMSPFDDPLMDEEDNAFIRIRRLLS